MPWQPGGALAEERALMRQRAQLAARVEHERAQLQATVVRLQDAGKGALHRLTPSRWGRSHLPWCMLGGFALGYWLGRDPR